MVPLLSSFISKKAIIFAVVLLLLIGVYIKGRYDGANLLEAQYTQEKLEWQSKISSMQKEFDDAVLKNMEDYLAESSKTKEIIRYVKSKPQIITKYVSKDSDSKCEIPNTFVELHNKAVDNTKMTELQSLNTSGVSNKKLSDVANTVTLNYYQYNEMKNKLETLQNIVKEYQSQQGKLPQ